MQVLFHLVTVVLFGIQDSVTCVTMKSPYQVVVVSIGETLLLNCTYNCSSGFVRGCWDSSLSGLSCPTEAKGNIPEGDICTLPWHVPNVTMEHIKDNYTCYTEETDEVHIPRKTELIVLLQLKELNPKTTPRSVNVPVKPGEDKGEFTGFKTLATVTIVVAMVLAVFLVTLCLMCRSRPKKGVFLGWPCLNKEKSTASNTDSKKNYIVLPPVIGPSSGQPDRVTLRIPTPDNQSDTEVSYADILITVRGASTPELNQIPYLSPGDHKRWGNEGGLSPTPRTHLQASRSADRLHVLPREVSRKMSTSSEYAVITYS